MAGDLAGDTRREVPFVGRQLAALALAVDRQRVRRLHLHLDIQGEGERERVEAGPEVGR
jgi:hypothetical protein